MKYQKFITIALIVISIFHASNVFAVKRAPFDDNSLQPMPVSDARPNISGNVNFESTKSGKETLFNQNKNSTSTNQNNLDINQKEERPSIPYIVIWTIISLFIIGLVFLAIIFLRSKK